MKRTVKEYFQARIDTKKMIFKALLSIRTTAFNNHISMKIFLRFVHICFLFDIQIKKFL